MFSPDSPFLNLPVALDRKQALFLDGMRHAAQIADLSYNRLCQALTETALNRAAQAGEWTFTHLFLDAWSFIDAVDRFRSLWEMQPAVPSANEYCPTNVRAALQDIRDVRNVSAHVAQKIDQIASLNAAVLGSINWLTRLEEDPPKIGTFFIRPGILQGNTKGQFAMANGDVSFTNGSGWISIAAGTHEANLSAAYGFLHSIVAFAELNLQLCFQDPRLLQRLPADMFASAELDLRGSQRDAI
jgi:hypothetical protein